MHIPVEYLHIFRCLQRLLERVSADAALHSRSYDLGEYGRIFGVLEDDEHLMISTPSVFV